MPLPRVDVVVVALGTPLKVGIYQNGQCIQEIVSKEKTSETLPKIFKEILDQFTIERIFFARGPGSFMSIKLVYIFLQTLKIAKGIKLYGCDGFAFTKGAPIKAVGKLYFVKDGNRIITKPMDEVEQNFELPEEIDQLQCGEETTPLYVIPAV